ncbi:DNA-directed DNA polymerase I [Pasteurella multocida]|uniref:DNA-directed DNA polymerase I n=2 Tax=Pasteurella multocida TaxID=747 RepID=UPI00027B20A6|nr:DNA-directed DNA polymerase I [Pasteurella multocida]APB80183.1 DNA-directed DNA polymerase I [Pasteurella multocida]EJS83425.1 DNA-directed DNA polymerase I [Pasteurella multocida subsp. multocida str. P52VAC]KEP93658.1 DNA-directed DNA polymerase I [Pasteurella multocida subsp. multocida VTCCBAA264]KLT47940.1 DNA-directed DNA polymerase I [Pasteurella multocida subsp. multocida]KLT50692.1 DNA-directed DNA polymerase I [Pasteurella multocida subsp. multocida]
MKPTKFKNLVYLDVETYFDREYSLSKMTMTEYIRDPRFKLHSIQMAINDGEIQYFDTDHIEDALVLLRSLDNWALVAQNTAFDAAILNWRYGIKPSFYYDTMSMSRGFWPTESASLKELAIRVFPDDETMRKGDELINFLGVETLTPEQHVVMARYGNQDVHLTREIFKKLVEYGYPEEELYQVHMVIRMYVEPSFVINRPLLETAIEEDVHETETAVEKALTMVKNLCKSKGVTLPYAFDKTLFSSNQRFAVLLKDALDIEPPIKLNAKGAPTYAFGKRDVPFIKMRDDYPEFEQIFNARELVKSTIAASRAATMLRCSQPSDLNPEGRLPVPLKYYGAATGRYSGCLSADTKIIVKHANNIVEEIPIVNLDDSDLVWDGEDFVTHGGVFFKGYKEVITYDGITGTEDHQVFTENGQTSLARAKQGGEAILDCPKPTYRKYQIDW